MRGLIVAGVVLLLLGAPSTSEMLGFVQSQPLPFVGQNTATAFAVDVDMAELEAGPAEAAGPDLQVAVISPSQAPHSGSEELDPASELAPPELDIRIVTARALNVRTEPSGDAAVLGKLMRDAEVTVQRESGDWVQVLSDDGIGGWVSAKYLAAA